jgi:hypothetical protein
VLLVGSLGVATAVVGTIRLAAASSPAPPTSVVPVQPYRILDTRNAIGTPDTAPVGPGATIEVQIGGVGPVPADAVGVVLNVTGTMTSEPTYVTAWPTGTPMPTASVLNLTPGIDAPNGVTALLGTGGRLSLFNFTGSTHLIADVAGYLVPATGGGSGPQGPAGPAGPAGPTGPTGVAQVVTRTFQFTFPADNGSTGQVLDDHVQCLSGEMVVGGGFEILQNASSGGQPMTVVLDSRPAGPTGAAPGNGGTPTGWWVQARRNTDTFAQDVVVYVLCASPA